MREEDILVASLLEEPVWTVERVAAACLVEPGWLLHRLEEGYFPRAEFTGGAWRLPFATLQRARRMAWLERDFEAVPELAAMVADLLEEMDALRAGQRG